MKFTVVQRPERDDVVIYASAGDVSFTLGPSDDERGGAQLRVQVVGPGEERPIFLRLDGQMYAALKEGMRSGPPTSPESDAVADARRTRDRLLRLVESEWMNRQRHGR